MTVWIRVVHIELTEKGYDFVVESRDDVRSRRVTVSRRPISVSDGCPYELIQGTAAHMSLPYDALTAYYELLHAEA